MIIMIIIIIMVLFLNKTINFILQNNLYRIYIEINMIIYLKLILVLKKLKQRTNIKLFIYLIILHFLQF